MNNENPRSTLAILLSLVISATSLAASPKPRIIVLTDISPATVEPDDMESIIRLFACADLVSANRGINDPEDPTQPSWGGQYVRKGSTRHYVDGLGGSTISRWKNQFQAEFKERADWTLP